MSQAGCKEKSPEGMHILHPFFLWFDFFPSTGRNTHCCLLVWQLVRFVRVTFRGHRVVGQLLALRFPWNLRASLVTCWNRVSAPMEAYKGHPRTREFAFIHSTELLWNEVTLGEGICLCKISKSQEMPPYCCGPRMYLPWRIYLPGRMPFS